MHAVSYRSTLWWGDVAPPHMRKDRMRHPFALLEIGTPRAVYFPQEGKYLVRTLAGVWKYNFDRGDDIIRPDDLRNFRVATDEELSVIEVETSGFFKGDGT